MLTVVPLTFTEVALGTDLTVPTLEGTTTIRIPPGTEPGRVFRLANRGLPRVGRSRRGDLHVQIELEVPDSLTKASKEELARWSDNLPGSAHPRRDAWDQAVQERR